MSAEAGSSSDGRNRQGTAPAIELRMLLDEMARGTPWRDALETLEVPGLHAKHHWLTDLGKARFYASLQTPARDCALDVGAGSGVIAHGLATHFSQVVALEHAEDWSEFMRRRFAQDSVRNIEVIHGSAVPLPFRPNTFDLVVVNGVLEWIPDSSTGDTPYQAQLRFLRDVRRVLRPAGAVGIAIENRCWLWNLRGASPHGEPPFAVVLPRALANWYSRRVTGRDYRNWIYTAWGYRRMLRAAGLRDIVVQQVQPTYHSPQEVLSLDETRAVKRYFPVRRQGGLMLLNLLARLGLLGYLAHSFYVQGRKCI